MKLRSILILLVSSFFLKTTYATTEPSTLKKHVEALAKLDRRWNSPELEQAAQYITQQFKQIGLKAQSQKFNVDELNYRNVFVDFGPKDSPAYVIGAHYDTCLAQGADDNASGVAGLLELARQLKKTETRLKSRFILVAWPLEEPPFFATENMGSHHHAKLMKKEKIKLKLMISLEMLGYYTDAPNSQRYPIKAMEKQYPDKGNFIAIVGRPLDQEFVQGMEASFKKSKLIPTESLLAPPIVTGVAFSDHRNYWIHGFNALMLTDTAFLRNPHYHKSSDTPETLNYEKMAAVIDSLISYLTP